MANLFDITSKSLEVAIEGTKLRHQLIVNNIANGDTPNFQSLDINFQDALKEKLALWRRNSVIKGRSTKSSLKRLEEREFNIAVKLSAEKKLDASLAE